MARDRLKIDRLGRGPVDCWEYSVERGNTARMDGDDKEVP